MTSKSRDTQSTPPPLETKDTHPMDPHRVYVPTSSSSADRGSNHTVDVPNNRAAQPVASTQVQRQPKHPPRIRPHITSADASGVETRVSYRRVPEWKRPSTIQARLTVFFLRLILYVALIPAMLSGGVIGASLKLGATWSDAVKNVSVVAETTVDTYRTHFDLLKLSAQILFRLEGEAQADDLDMIAYVAEVRSKTSELSASLDRALADYVKRQVKRSKERKAAQAQNQSGADSSPVAAPISLGDILFSGVIGAFCPLILYWILGYFMTRWWLNVRARETVEFHRKRIEKYKLERTSVRELLS